ncbi:MAG TPA: GAF domain-containing SpoIIE family protein phosphatase [Acidimicrobiia bacterium]|jgi:serine phosphatase RsbU (regulator of sigma subunit)
MGVEGRLADLRALTDETLSRLDVDELLVELLTRLREIIDVDTAAVLMLDRHTDELVARAACGIEEEVRQGVRIPLGRGFAGGIAASRQAVRLDRVDATTVTNPILWESGIQVMLGVPLLRGDAVLGVLHVGRLAKQPFTEQDIELLQVAADRIAGAAETQELALERVATSLIERSLLPARLPVCAGLSFATRYVAAESNNVGGDWYDLFTMPSGQLWIVVGDVAGHGLQSAIVMSRIRSALRAYTMLDASPAHVLDLVDKKVRHFEIGTFATVACATLDPPYDTMTLASAGHPPPVLCGPDGTARFAPLEISPPVGTSVGRQRRATTVPIDPGTTIAFYTDGLIERRGESLDVGLARLADAISTGAPNGVAADIMRALIGKSIPRDDIALVVMRRDGAEA